MRTRGGEWIAAPVMPGAFVVNIGDCLMRWTNDIYVSTPHRVVNRSGRERYSIAFFFDPNPDARVAAIPSCVPAGESPSYPPISAADYLKMPARREQAGGDVGARRREGATAMPRSPPAPAGGSEGRPCASPFSGRFACATSGHERRPAPRRRLGADARKAFARRRAPAPNSPRRCARSACPSAR